MSDDQEFLDPFSELRIDFWREIGLTINDEKFFDRAIANYSYDEIMYQNIDHFFVGTNDNDIKPKRRTSFEEIYDFYFLDQHLKNVMMISLQLSEQSFKVALTETAFVEKNKNFSRNLNSLTIHRKQFLNENISYKMEE